MTYKLEKGQNLGDNLSQIHKDEIDESLEALRSLSLHDAIHDLRKRLKKIRALARLVRDEIGEKEYKKINVFYRDLGKELAEIRDLTAHLETVEKLKERYGNLIYVRFFNSLTKKIEEKRSKLEDELNQRDFFDTYLIEKLEEGKENFAEWPVGGDIQKIFPNIERVYKRGQKALKEAYNNPSRENFHEWRKRVKYLWYQIILLQDAWPEFFESFETELHLLSDYLGDDHDLLVFQAKIESHFIELDDNEKELLNGLLREQSRILRNKARLTGELIFAEKPKDFVKRLSAYTKINWN